MSRVINTIKGILKWKGEWDHQHRLHERDGILKGEIALGIKRIGKNVEIK